MIDLQCYASFDEAAALGPEIDALNRDSPRPDPFSTFAFMAHFAREAETPVGEGAGTLWLLAARRAGRLVGFIALRRSKRLVMGLPVATLGLLVAHDADRPHLLARSEDLAEVGAAVYAYLLSRAGEWSLLEFPQQDAHSPLLLPPPGLDMAAHVAHEWPSLENGTVRILWPTLQAYGQAMPKKFRANLARQLRRLQDAGELELLSSADPRATPALLDLYLAVEPQSWKAAAHAGVLRSARREHYVRGLLDAAQPMRVSVHVLLLGGQPIAGLVNGAFLDGLYALHIVYDQRHARLAPGSAMLLLGMLEAMAGHCRFYNLMSGFGYYKQSWLAEITETRIVQVYRRGSLPHWHRRLGDAKRSLLSRFGRVAPVRFNPARRAVVGLFAPRETDAGPRNAALVDAARRHGAATRSHRALAQALQLMPAG